MFFENIGEDGVGKIAKFVAQRLKKGDIIHLTGELGAGKTFFTRCLANAFGGDECDVTSPTFAVMNLYNWNGTNVYHMDFYRLSGFELEEMGMDEILDDNKSIKIVEWPEKFDSWIEYENIKKITIKYSNGIVNDNYKESRSYVLEGF